MATTFPSSDKHFDSSIVARHVADDLSSIFGADRRSASRTVPVETDRRPATRRRPLLVLAAGAGMAVMVAGGLFVGNEATGGVEGARPVERSRPAPVVRPVVALSATTLPARAAQPADDGAATIPPEVRSTVTARAEMASEGPLREASVQQSQPAPLRYSYPVAEQPAPAIVMPTRSSSCDDGDGCADTALAVADRRVANAYDAAIGAGVRNRDLRDYRAEWVRARGRATADPQGALRIYAMVAADLDTLAQDAAARPDLAWR